MHIDKEVFDKNLALTQSYCESVLKNGIEDPAKALRTFNPLLNGDRVFKFVEYGQYTGTEWVENPWPYATIPYEDIYLQQLEHKKSVIHISGEPVAYDGRILIAELDQTLAEGASEANSEGFVDVYDCPPIDTWFYLTEHDNFCVLFAWIPYRFIELAQDAIDVNSTDCLSWCDEERLACSSKVLENILNLKQSFSQPPLPRLKYLERLRSLFK